MPWTVDPPTYNSRYGFTDGAQTDIFIAAPLEPSSFSSSTSPTGSSSSSEGGATAAPTSSIPSSAGLAASVGYRIPGKSCKSR
jgi:hypothetical protein